MKIDTFLTKSPLVPLINTGRTLSSSLDESFKKLNLNMIDSLILCAVFFEGRPCSPSEIALSLDLSRSQVSQSLKRLTQQGLLERSLNKEDSRFLNLKLTITGKAKSQKIIKIFDDLTQRIEKALGSRASEEMAPQLKKLTLKN